MDRHPRGTRLCGLPLIRTPNGVGGTNCALFDPGIQEILTPDWNFFPLPLH
jgi:hypothetical protein